MARYTVVVDRKSDWKWDSDDIILTRADDYLSQPDKPRTRTGRVINLCRHYDYLSGGYYVSLLAEARDAIPMPTVTDIIDLASKAQYAFALPEIESLLNDYLQKWSVPPADSFTLDIFFGRTEDPALKKVARTAFDTFRYPLLQLKIQKARGLEPAWWQVKSMRPMGIHQIKPEQHLFFHEAFRAFTGARPTQRKAKKPALYDLAILVDPKEALPPSDPDALRRFEKAGQALRMDITFITAKDYHRIPEFDALFIRETTALDHHTFRFARKAEIEGMPVIDSPSSILRCANKVFLAEALTAHNIATPRTITLNRNSFDDAQLDQLEDALGYPIVLKIPDGSFSRGVVKAEDRETLTRTAHELLERSRIILAQEFMYTTFDWRIGVLNRQPIFACQYKMSRNHWQIYNHKSDGSVASGGFTTMAVEDAPQDVVQTALKASGLIGDGLYGIDLKQNDNGVFVIEVNDNPNIDHGVEDKVAKGALYEIVLKDIIRRIDDR